MAMQVEGEEQLGHRLAGSERLLAAAVRLPVHIYTAELTSDHIGYRETYSGPGLNWFLGSLGDDVGDAELAWDSAVHPDDWDAYVGMDVHLRAGAQGEATYRLIGHDNVTRWVRETVVPRPHAAGQPCIFDGLIVNVTAHRLEMEALRRRLEEAEAAAGAAHRARLGAERRARLDELTGLSNRRHFRELLRRTVMRASRSGRPVALILLDLDDFKTVNDTFGHSAGDEILIEVARRLSRAVRATDTVARWGGEEFIVLLADVDSTAALTARAQELQTALSSTPVFVEGHELLVRASYGGVSRVPPPGASQLLIEAADRALYAAKGAGRNRVAIA